MADTKKDMISYIETYCRQKELLLPGDRVLLGLSGGADSVCLFLVLLALAEKWNLTLVPVHINHNIRGAEAEADQQFCMELCRQHRIPLEVVSVPVRKLAEEHGWTLEEAGRNARYQVFRERKERYHCQKIAVAHHKNDQAETMLFQLIRGSRLKGLAGMEPRHEDIIRPLLAVTRKEIEQFLLQRNQIFCIDHTNFEEEYTRNLIRSRIIPAAQKIQTRAVEHMAETAEYIGRAEKFLEGLTTELYQRAVTEYGEGDLAVSIPVLVEADPFLAERVMYRALCRAAGGRKDMTADFVSDCMALMGKQTGRQIMLPENLVVKRSYDQLKFKKGSVTAVYHCEEICAFPYETFLSGIGKKLTITVENWNIGERIFQEKLRFIPKSTYTKSFDYDKINGVVSLRSPTPEDSIVLYADGRKKKVMDVLKDARVPKEDRINYWILCDEVQTLWIPGIRGSEAYRITEETKQVLTAEIDGGREDGG
ncbi:MAG: tRNA lysidine(34) synthetase TilS [Lachnospiraceae bacterium]|nr:tRNA lysidine(34) synthetase TilS [Lachnospiraceae bacterium]